MNRTVLLLATLAASALGIGSFFLVTRVQKVRAGAAQEPFTVVYLEHEYGRDGTEAHSRRVTFGKRKDGSWARTVTQKWTGPPEALPTGVLEFRFVADYS